MPRLVEFSPPSWRDAAQMTTTNSQILSDKLLNQPSGTAIFIAEDSDGAALVLSNQSNCSNKLICVILKDAKKKTNHPIIRNRTKFFDIDSN